MNISAGLAVPTRHAATRALSALALLLSILSPAALWGQTAQITGKIVDKAGKPLAEAQIVYTSLTTGKSFKVKTDKNGEFTQLGVAYDHYQIEVLGPDGQSLFQQKVNVTQAPEGRHLVLDLSSQSGPEAPAISEEQAQALKEKNAQLTAENALITKCQTAQQDKNWAEAENLLSQLIALNPNRWEYQKSMGDTQLNEGKYVEAVATYEKTIAAARSEAAPADPAKTKIALAQMLTSEGNSYLKLAKNEEAIRAFSKAAEISPNPGAAYFNLCATQYNAGNAEAALAACDKAIAADPKKADAYFIKGSVLIAGGNVDAQGKLTAPPGTVEALNKYLELAPDGGHAADVKLMLDMIGSKIDTTYKEKKK